MLVLNLKKKQLGKIRNEKKKFQNNENNNKNLFAFFLPIKQINFHDTQDAYCITIKLSYKEYCNRKIASKNSL